MKTYIFISYGEEVLINAISIESAIIIFKKWYGHLDVDSIKEQSKN